MCVQHEEHVCTHDPSHGSYTVILTPTKLPSGFFRFNFTGNITPTPLKNIRIQLKQDNTILHETIIKAYETTFNISTVSETSPDSLVSVIALVPSCMLECPTFYIP